VTVELIELIAAKGVFRPRGHFSQLAADHVPFDRQVGQDRYESAALGALTADASVGVVGPRGAARPWTTSISSATSVKRSTAPAPTTTPGRARPEGCEAARLAAGRFPLKFTPS